MSLVLVIKYERFSCRHLKMFINQSKTRKSGPVYSR